MPDTYAKCLDRLAALGSVRMYKYDMCNKEGCHVVYRCAFKHHDQCPKCGTSRTPAPTMKRRILCYMSLLDHVRMLFASKDLAR